MPRQWFVVQSELVEESPRELIETDEEFGSAQRNATSAASTATDRTDLGTSGNTPPDNPNPPAPEHNWRNHPPVGPGRKQNLKITANWPR
ncbi:hypothetical protein ABIA39_005695 [Nocardia sp. GAS34]|uniref:hypothetical protein n=1 Tax=unclassified Nocardia TaxID=2637762 RepID=UPI003D2103D2